jgi:hypothetical protein
MFDKVIDFYFDSYVKLFLGMYYMPYFLAGAPTANEILAGICKK